MHAFFLGNDQGAFGKAAAKSLWLLAPDYCVDCKLTNLRALLTGASRMHQGR